MKDFKKLPKMACGGGVKKYAEGKSVVYGADIVAEASKRMARRPTGPNAYKDPDIFEPRGKLSSIPIPTDNSTKRGSMPIPLSPLRNISDYKKRGGTVKKKK